MKTKIEIKDVKDKILFTHESEKNSVKKTVEEAVNGSIPLRGAKLWGADLHDADLCDADLRGAKLWGADLRGAKLWGADLWGADLCCADLHDAKLWDADLRGAKLWGADLWGADLCCADLHDAKLWDADLRGAKLWGAKNIPFIPLSCPSDGAFIGWKKVKGCLIKLLIPEDAKRSSATTGKCRCDKAKVLEIINLKTNKQIDKVTNKEYATCTYKVGEMVYPDKFDDERWKECSNGIHFFINKQEAVEY